MFVAAPPVDDDRPGDGAGAEAIQVRVQQRCQPMPLRKMVDEIPVQPGGKEAEQAFAVGRPEGDSGRGAKELGFWAQRESTVKRSGTSGGSLTATP